MVEKKDWTRFTVLWMALAVLIASAFWGNWNLVFGQIPVLETVTMISEKTDAGGAITRPAWILTLPFGLSRSWDILGAPMFVWFLSFLWRWARAKGQKQKNLVFDLIVGLFTGALVLGTVGPAGILFVGLIATLFVASIRGSNESLIFVLGFSLVPGFWFGFLPGLAVFAVIASSIWLIAGTIIVWRALRLALLGFWYEVIRSRSC